ncbi:anaerobic C4-dicarboxylate transporter DcuC [Jinshanibacter sp. LJY008]|uniref:Anaerobic C4-dicarboxylate transporter DcuC n=1 Tax=Limnobaculum eriocheiris TaxID=2897391 RepID=A0A9X1SLI9_9GAMM|nr:anaerobic C4-dicarboxylate transporter DcuC [Limnobaculum eriocheiris]MCD1126860.1 anaerobic C4-dicarboxylate transporter DcuC [Limnobaculum eriocheiris]
MDVPYTVNLLIGAIVAVAVGYYIIKGYSATGVLLIGGLLLLLISIGFGRPILAEKASTGFLLTDVFEFMKTLLSNRAADLGMMIMILCGFAAYMTHIGANDMVVKLASHPLKYINSPYILMIAAYFVACLMSLAVSSATGLGVLLMATLFPLMVNVGISRGAATAICASPAAIILSPTSGDVIVAAEASKMGGDKLIEFAFHTTLPISIIAIIAIAITHFFWQRYLDKKENIVNEKLDVSQIKTHAPVAYAILPFLPIIGVLVFSGKISLPFTNEQGVAHVIPNLNIITIIIICMVLTAIIEFLRTFSAKKMFAGLDSAYQAMGDAFVTVVMLLVAAGIFAQGLSSIGFIAGLIQLAESSGGGAMIMMLVLVIITMLAAMATGSGNAPFYAFVEFIPKLADQMGINPAYLVIPMLQASNIGRSMSPVSGVVVATSGMAKISPFEVVKRTSVPMIVGIVVVIIASHFRVPLHL